MVYRGNVVDWWGLTVPSFQVWNGMERWNGTTRRENRIKNKSFRVP